MVEPENTEGEEQGEEPLRRDEFPATRWSLLLQAGETEDDPLRAQALSDLCEMYWFPIYAYVRRRGSSAEDAEDVTQGFFTQLLRRGQFGKMAELDGRLRAYLLGAVKNFMRSDERKRVAEKRGGGAQHFSIDSEHAEDRYAADPSHDENPERLFERQWALTLLERGFDRLEGHYETLGKRETFEVLRPVMDRSGDRVPFADLGATLGITEGNARVAAHRMRQKYRVFLREEIAQTVGDDVGVDDELRHLLAVLAS